jgi:hypothetical protein
MVHTSVLAKIQKETTTASSEPKFITRCLNRHDDPPDALSTDFSYFIGYT